ncbi:MAG: universal stress protein [Nitrospira sp.]|nr:universal stress protein [Nitrospira sp.]
MRQDTDLFKTILVPVDFSPCSEEAFRVACQLARMCGAAVLVLHVIDTNTLAAFHRLGLLAVPSDAAPQRRRLRHHARLNVRELLESNAAANVKIERRIVEGVPFSEIAKVARIGNIDLVVIGGYGGRVGSVDKIFFGSTAEKVVRTAGCPVLTVPLPVSVPRRGASR